MRNKNSPNKSPSAKTLRPRAQANASKDEEKDQAEPMDEDANPLADSGGERAEREEIEATFSPDEEEDDHDAKDIAHRGGHGAHKHRYDNERSTASGRDRCQPRTQGTATDSKVDPLLGGSRSG